MKKFPDIINWLLLAGVVVFISFLYPEKGVFKYNYEEGYTWKYEDLVAPFDFAIQRPEAEVQSEITDITNSFSPYFILDRSIVEKQKNTFDRDLASQRPFLSQYEPGFSNYEDLGEILLEEIYDQGVIDLTRYDSILKGKNEIHLIRGKIATKRSVNSFYDPFEAKRFITDSLRMTNIRGADILLPILTGLVRDNVFYNDSLSSQVLAEKIDDVPTASGMVKKGELIVPSGGQVTPSVRQKLDSLRDKYQNEINRGFSHTWVIAAYILLTALIMLVYYFYVLHHNEYVFKKWKNMVFTLMWFVLYAWFVFLVEQTEILSAYLIPFCIVPILLKNFFNERLAFFTHVCIILVASFLTSLDFEFTLLHILAGAVAVLSDTQTRYWNKFFASIGSIFLTYALGYIGLSVIHTGSFIGIQWYNLIWLFVNAFLLLLAYPLIPLLERIFGFTSSISLAELSDLNRPLLKELSMQAPGTFQHSLQVANLAESAAEAIGANSLLVKVAALYHDIGKLKHPEYFVENQQGDNPHNEISPEESARIIIEHVSHGAELARKARLPKVLIDFILSHHGTTRVAFFYHRALEEDSEYDIDPENFRYPGPVPKTKEECILMMADSLEAASKSLRNPTGQDIDELVDKIMTGKLQQNQFDASDLSFKEMETSKKVFRKVLRSINHVRIEYPDESE